MPARWPAQVVTTVVETDAGRFSLSVTATFALKLHHGKVATPTEEKPQLDDDERAAFELDARAPYKPRVDLLVSGHASIPDGEPEAERLLVRLRLGDFTKAVRAVGNRVWVKEDGKLVASPPRKFRRLRLGVERAARTPENPGGIAADAIPAEGRNALPNFEPVTPQGSATLGPVPDGAAMRTQLAGDAGLAWPRAVALAATGGPAAGPKPATLNYAFFNLAPRDQQLDGLAEGSALVLEGLHATHAVFTSRMPSFDATTEVIAREGDPPSSLRLRVDTLWVLPDQELLVLRGRALLPLPGPAFTGRADVDVRSRDAEPAAPTPEMQHTRVAVDVPVEQALPFQSRPAQPATTMFVTQELQLGGESALPFGPGPEDTTTHDLPGEAPARPQTADGGPPREAGTRARAVLPFKALGDEDSTPDHVGDTIPPAAGADDLAGDLSPAKLRPPELGPTRSPPLPPDDGSQDDADRMRTVPLRRLEEGPKASPLATPSALRPAAPPAPTPDARTTSMRALGAPLSPPLSPGTTAAMPPLVPLEGPSFDAPTTTADVKLSLRETEELLSAARSSFPLPPSDGFEVDGVTLEHCAVIRAQLNAKPGDRATIFEHHGLTDATFARIERTHLRRVDEANQREEGDLLARYDAAYIAAFESIVRPIDVATYARMAVAKERGDLGPILAELNLPRTEFMRIERVWARRIAADRLLGEGFQQAVARARGRQR